LNLTHSISDLSSAGCIVNLIAFAASLRQPGLRKYFPAVVVYMGVSGISAIVLAALIHVHHFLAPQAMYDLYFGLFWLSYLVCSIALMYCVRQGFEYIMEPLPGLKKLGSMFFSWVAIVSVLVVIGTAIHPYGLSFRAIPIAMFELMRCTSLLELCLLAFLAVFAHTLGLSYRSHVFGLGLGLGVLATSDFLFSALRHSGSSMMTTASLVPEAGTVCAYLLLTCYFLLPDPERKAMLVPADSQLLRWNEIAMAIGHSGGQVVMTPAPKTFFLDEVEHTVDRVMSRNSIDI
jgi:hypothetical protein